MPRTGHERAPRDTRRSDSDLHNGVGTASLRARGASAEALRDSDPTTPAHAVVAENVNIGYRLARDNSWLTAVDGIDLTVPAGQFVSILGPSGCGKSTFLDAIAGLQSIHSGRLEVNGSPVSKAGEHTSMVFQRASLLPWRTVLDNTTFGLEMQGVRRREARTRAQELLELVGLGPFMDVFPVELSGGMQQRVNLARALAVDPDVLLLDEPFASLDALSRETMQLELLRIWSETKKTAIFVTHDVREALLLSDTVVIMSPRPARVRDIFTVDIPRPRSQALFRDPLFLEFEDRASSQLHDS